MLALLACQGANAGEIVVISNLEINVSPDEIEDIYTGEKQFSGSTRLVPIDNAVLQESFLARLLQTDIVAYDRLWTQKLFRDGLIKPEIKASDAAVIAYVKQTPGAIGYVSTSPPGVKVIQRVSTK
jgi:ABC-type phosphate transport system substrate-binding protein